jgi:hypothetical protein
MLGLCSRPARAEEQCASPLIQLDLQGRPEWEAEVPALRARLRSLEHVDTCAHVAIRAEEHGVLVNVTSRGRSATRFVSEPSELVHTVEALVVLPPPLEEPPAVTPTTAPPRESEPVKSPPATHMEIAGGASVRLGGNPLIVGGGMATSAGLVDHGWLIGVSARWEFAANFVSLTPPSGFSMGSGAVGVEFGRRWGFGGFNYDVLVGPTVALESQEAYGPSTGKDEGIGGSAIDARLNLKLRASGPSSARVRVYATGDVEVSPRRLFHQKQLDPELPPLPAWTSGIAVGVLWGAR